MCARAELWRPRGSAAAFSASSAAAPWPSVTEDDVGSFRKWRVEARSPGPRTGPPTLRRWDRSQLRKVWASRGRIPPGVGLASDVYSPSAHLRPPASLPARTLGGESPPRGGGGSERDVVFAAAGGGALGEVVVRGVGRHVAAAAAGRARSFATGRAALARSASAVAAATAGEDDVVGDDLGRVALLAVFLVTRGLEATFDQ